MICSTFFLIIQLLICESFSASAFQLALVRRASLSTTKHTKSSSYGNSLPSSLSSLHASTAGNSSEKKVLDTSAISKYFIAGGVELSLFSATFFAIDQILISTGTSPASPIIWFLFYVTSLKSRIFNPLDNSRPDRKKIVDGDEEANSSGFQDRIMPKWTPPGITFPIVWLLVIGPLRATSSMIIVNSTGGFFSFPIMSLLFHLTIGDIWNSINNIEKRYGASVVGVGLVYISALHAVYQFSQVDELAGTLLGVTLIWLTIASSLIIQTWRLNVDKNGAKDSLLPMVNKNGESLTKFSWFS